VVLHEMMHNLGFLHEHNRIDRNQYVTVNFTNILPEARNNYIQNEDPADDWPNCDTTVVTAQSIYDDCDNGITGETYGLPYDYESIMHNDEHT
jgi:hypothetical protein